jgi:hypothetical protein
VIVLAGLAGLVAPLFMRVPIRSAAIQWRVGLLIFVAASISGAVMGPPPQTGLPASRVILALIILFGGFLFAYGIAVILVGRADKYDRRLRHLFRVRRLRRRIQPKCSIEEKRAVVREYMASRRRHRLNRASLHKDIRGAAPVIRIYSGPSRFKASGGHCWGYVKLCVHRARAMRASDEVTGATNEGLGLHARPWRYADP